MYIYVHDFIMIYDVFLKGSMIILLWSYNDFVMILCWF